MRSTLFFLLIFYITNLWAIDIEELSTGEPISIKENKLDASLYQSFEAKQLSRPKLIWLNFELLRDLGISIPEDGITEEFKQNLMKEFAYSVPQENDDMSSFTNNKKTFYADRYGGEGAGLNQGSGRAGVTGAFQVKGIGRTPLVSTQTSFDHNHGGASLRESIQEAIWGEVSHRELPMGGNRVLMIIDSGTYTTWSDGSKEARALIVREDAIRPAHFIEVAHKNSEKVDSKRVEANLKKIGRVLPFPAGANKDDYDYLKQTKYGFKQAGLNFGGQYGVATAKKLYHGGSSPSNIELDGKFIDYGTMTYLPDYGEVKVLQDGIPFGQELNYHDKMSFGVLRDALYNNKIFNEEDFRNIIDDMSETFKRAYQYNLDIGLLEQIGLPEEVAKELYKDEKVVQELQEFFRLAQSSSKNLHIDKVIPLTFGADNYARFLLAVSKNHDKDLENLRRLLPHLSDSIQNDRFSYFFHELFKEGKIIAKSLGYTEEGISEFIKLKAEMRLDHNPALLRSNMINHTINLVDEYNQTKSVTNISQFIRKSINESIIDPIHLSDNVILLKLKDDLYGNTSQKLIFNGKTNTKKLIFETKIIGDSVYLFNQKIPLSSLENGFVRVSSNHWRSYEDIPLKIKNGILSFEYDRVGSFDIEFKLRDKEGKQWFGHNDQNIKFKLPKSVIKCTKFFKYY